MMDEDTTNRHGQTDAELPLPKEVGGSKRRPKKIGNGNPAADLIRKKVEAAYAHEPDAEQEVTDLSHMDKGARRTKHQQYIYDLTNSGLSVSEIQSEWHEYYAGLPDKEKHEVWEEFYKAHSKASQYSAHASKAGGDDEHEAAHQTTHRPYRHTARKNQLSTAVGSVKDSIRSSLDNFARPKQASPLRSLLFGLGAGAVVMLIFLFGLFNERFIAPFIQPSRTVTNTPIIADTTVAGPEPEIIIPKINVEIPVIYDLGTTQESAVQKALEDGVVHYSNTAQPGETGNAVIVGHSSNNIFNKGKYKFAFVLLNRMEIGDTFYLQKEGKRYTYEIYERRVVSPNDVSVLDNQDELATATLITCDPPGSTAKRLVVIGKQISPDPGENLARDDRPIASEVSVLPGNAPSLWSRFVKWFTG